MDDFSSDEIDSIVQAIQTEPEKLDKIPLRPPGEYIAKLTFSPLEGEKPRPLEKLTEKEVGRFGDLKAQIEVVYGKTKLTIKELAAIKEGSLLPLDDLSDDLVDIYANGERIARGEVVAVDGSFGVRIVTFC